MTHADWWARVVQARTRHDDGEWRRMRLFRAHEQAELSGAIADTRATFEAKGRS